MPHCRRYSAENSYGPEQLTWARQINIERDNIRAALAFAIDVENAGLAVKLVASHPHRQAMSGYPMGEVLLAPVFRVLDLPGASDAARVRPRPRRRGASIRLRRRLCQRTRALPTGSRGRGQASDAPLHGPRIEMDEWILKAAAELWSGAYTEAAVAYERAAEIADSEGYPGIAAMLLAYSVNSELLGGGKLERSGRQGRGGTRCSRGSRESQAAIVSSLNSLCAHDCRAATPRARGLLLRESVELSTVPGEEITNGLLTACMVAGRLRDWELTLALAGRSFVQRTAGSWRRLQAATTLAECARAFAETNTGGCGHPRLVPPTPPSHKPIPSSARDIRLRAPR